MSWNGVNPQGSFNEVEWSRESLGEMVEGCLDEHSQLTGCAQHPSLTSTSMTSLATVLDLRPQAIKLAKHKRSPLVCPWDADNFEGRVVAEYQV